MRRCRHHRFFTPWRYPATPYWKLMLAPHGMFFLAAAWGVWVFGGLDAISLTWWNALWFLPAMIPLVLFSRKTWAGYSPKR